jgi:hypothetical protein
MLDRLPFKHVVAVDFEFEFGGHDTPAAASRSGERPRPVCMVAKELRSGQTWRLWRGQFEAQPPFTLDNDTVLIAYYASAELGCFKALGWPQPRHMLDLFTEFRARTNGVQYGASLIVAATHFGIDAIDSNAKQGMVAHILRGGPWSADDRSDILHYCEGDVLLLERLLPAMLRGIDLPRALLRGRFMRAAAAIEWNGIPIDTVTLGLLRHHWTGIQDELIAEIDRNYGVFEGAVFGRNAGSTGSQNRIAWPTTDTGQQTRRQDVPRWPRRTRDAPMRNCAAPCRRCGSPILLAVTAATARSCRHFNPALAAVSQAMQVYLWPQCLAARPDPATERLGRLP